MRVLFAMGVFLSGIALKAQLPNYVPLNGLKGYWPFSGNANDISVNAYNGINYGATLTTDRFGNANSAYAFNGISNYILTNYAGILGANPRAISFWAKSTQTTGLMYQVTWGNNQPGARFGIGFSDTPSGVGVGGYATDVVYATSAPVSGGAWHHYVAQFNGITFSNVDIYQDAVLLTQVVTPNAPNTLVNTLAGFNVQFGRVDYPSYPEYFNGTLDDFGIWNRKLTLCEIKALYASALPSIGIMVPAISICAGQQVTLTATAASAYIWSTQQQNTSTIVVTPTANTSYSVSGLDNGCPATGSLTLIVETCTGINALSATTSEPVLFPNPTKGLLYLERLEKNTVVALYNVLGELVVETTASEENMEIDLTRQPRGVYLLRLTSGSSVITRKVIVN